jgi:hypothetical protein
MLIDLGLMREGESAEEDKAFEHLFRNVWADNADVVSKSYSGTGALKTDFTRLGVRTKAGALQDLNNSITRYCLNNFADGPRQDGFDLFLGNYLPSDGVGSGQLLFADRRPLFIQSIPYILAAAIFFILVGSLTRRAPDATVWPLRLLLLISLVTAGICANFIWGHGTLYVNWPKLNRQPPQIEAFQETLQKVRNNPVVGPLVGGSTKHERGKSDARLLGLEEGKKRIE